jgi:uncharacterized protein DUF4129
MSVIASFVVFSHVVTGRRMSRPTRAPLWAQFLTLVFVVLSLGALQKAGILGRFGDNDAKDQVVNDGPLGSPAPGSADHVTRSATLGVVVTIVLVLVLGAILVLTVSVLRRERGVRGELFDPEKEAILEGVDAGIEDLARVTDPRAAVIACYARMEAALSTAGLSRRPSEAPLEFLARVLTERNVLESSATTLTALFERARFSEHEIDESMRADASSALRAVSEQIRGGS